MSAIASERGESRSRSAARPAAFESLEGRVMFSVAVDYAGGIANHAASNVAASAHKFSPSARTKKFNYWPAQTLKVYTSPNQGSSSFAIADFNSDNHPDLLFNTGNGYITVLLNSGVGNFHQVTPIDNGTDPTHAHTQYPASSILLGAFANSNHLDIAVASYDPFQNTSRFAVLPGNGDGTFGLPISQTAPAGPVRLLGTGDVNNDGGTDLIVASGPQSIPLINNGSGTFTPGTPITVANVTVTDLNADDIPDIISPTGGTTNDNGPLVRLGLGNGTFGPAMDLPIDGSTGPMTFTVADFNNDNSPDLIATDTGATVGGKRASHVYFLSGRGNGTFEGPTLVTSTTAGGPNQIQPEFKVAAGDVNGDGTLDFVTVSPKTSGSRITGYTLRTFLGGGNGSFHETVSRSLPGNSLSSPTVRIADIDGDGKGDVILGGLKANQATIYYTFFE